eukprot:6429839-Lingulodinium_polyedra.AAC.1
MAYRNSSSTPPPTHRKPSSLRRPWMLRTATAPRACAPTGHARGPTRPRGNRNGRPMPQRTVSRNKNELCAAGWLALQNKPRIRPEHKIYTTRENERAFAHAPAPPKRGCQRSAQPTLGAPRGLQPPKNLTA